jgi:four helix bundle protein
MVQGRHERWERWQTQLWDRIFHATHDIVMLTNHLDQGRGEQLVSESLLASAMGVGSALVRANAADSQTQFVAAIREARLKAIETDYWLRLVYALQQRKAVKHDVSSMITQYASIVDLLRKYLTHITQEAKSIHHHTKGALVQ